MGDVVLFFFGVAVEGGKVDSIWYPFNSLFVLERDDCWVARRIYAAKLIFDLLVDLLVADLLQYLQGLVFVEESELVSDQSVQRLGSQGERDKGAQEGVALVDRHKFNSTRSC